MRGYGFGFHHANKKVVPATAERSALISQRIFGRLHVPKETQLPFGTRL
jgi:hypothetical protein